MYSSLSLLLKLSFWSAAVPVLCCGTVWCAQMKQLSWQRAKQFSPVKIKVQSLNWGLHSPCTQCVRWRVGAGPLGDADFSKGIVPKALAASSVRLNVCCKSLLCFPVCMWLSGMYPWQIAVPVHSYSFRNKAARAEGQLGEPWSTHQLQVMAERDQLSSPGACCASWAASSQKSPQPFSQGWSLCLHYSSLTNPVREFIAQWSQQCVVCSLTRRWSLLLSGLSMGAVCLTLCCCCFFQSFKSVWVWVQLV